MKIFTDTLNQKMHEAFQALKMDAGSFLHRAERSFQIAESHLLQLREFIAGYTFTDEEEEILFFKHIKPSFHKELLYWGEIIRIEAGWPSGSPGDIKRYQKQMLREINGFFARHQFLYEYYKLERSHMDNMLYLREANYTPLFPIDSSDLDRTFSTLPGNIRAAIMALEEVAVWLLNKREKQDSNLSAQESQALVWTGSKAQLIELVYALQSYGVFNHGKTNVKEVMAYMQHCFKVDKVANYYGYFQGMRIRKKDRTPFLNGLIEQTLRRMDESDEFPRFS